MSELAKNLSITALMLVVETLAAKELYDINRTTENFEFLCEKRGKLETYIAELEAYIDQLIEVGNGMKSFLTPYVDGFRDSYPATSAWESLVKDWKEREI